MKNNNSHVAYNLYRYFPRNSCGGGKTSFCRLLVIIIVMILLHGCQTGIISSGRSEVELAPPPGDSARLNLFLALKNPSGPAMRLDAENFEVLADRLWMPLDVAPLTLDSEKIGAGQLFLGGRWLPPGNFAGLRFTVNKIFLKEGIGEYQQVAIGPLTMELALSEPIPVEKDDSQSLFINWDVQKSLEDPRNLQSGMTIAVPVRQFFADIVYVSCPDIDTIFVIRCDKNWVVDSFGLKGRPTYLALDPVPSRQRLYVLASRESSIKVVELNSQRVIDSYPVPLIEKPAFFTISSDGQWAYILDDKKNYLIRLDLQTGTLLARVHLGYRPQYASYLEDSNLLAVSSVISQLISFHDPLDLNEIVSIQTGTSPEGLLAANGQLYVAESGANTVSVIDVARNLIQNRITVGFTPRRLLNIGRQIYVSNYDSGSISVIYRGQLGVGREINGLGRPLEMIYNQNFRWLYAGDDEKEALAFIDSTTNQLRGYINLGASPLGLAIIQ